jgi:site-specific recombinase XerC
MRQLLTHYREHWHGELPVSAPTLKEYILSMAGQVDVRLIRARVNAIGKWHRDNSFVDPSTDNALREMLRGVVKVHRHDHLPFQGTRALTFKELVKICQDLESRRTNASHARSCEFLSAHRDRAICLLGYWAGLTGSKLEELNLANINFPSMGGLDIAISIANARSDQRQVYSIHHLEQMTELCPVEALRNWLRVSKVSQGPIFRAINRWGQISQNRLSQSGINFLLQRADPSSKLSDAKLSSRSLPRGFADWANENGWGDLDIRDYLGVTSDRSVYSLHPSRSRAFAFRTVLLCGPRPRADNS